MANALIKEKEKELRHNLVLVAAHPSAGTRMFGSYIGSHPKVVHFFEKVGRSRNFLDEKWKEAINKNLCYIFDLKYQHCNNKIIAWILEKKPPIIHLIRSNALEIATAEFWRTGGGRSGVVVDVLPFQIIEKEMEILEEVISFQKIICKSGCKTMILLYEHLCGWDGGCLAGDYDSREINDLIFEFLGVEKSVLRCEEKKIHGGISSKVNVKFPGIQRERAFQIIKEKAK